MSAMTACLSATLEKDLMLRVNQSLCHSVYSDIDSRYMQIRYNTIRVSLGKSSPIVASLRSLCCFSALLKRCGHYHGCRPDASCIKFKLDIVTHPEAMCQSLRKPPKLKKTLMLSLKSGFEKPM